MTTLIIGAHPDDETLGCGGTIARLASEGEDVSILILGEGLTSREGVSQEDIEALRALAEQRGSQVGLNAAEAFCLVRSMERRTA